MWEEIKIWLMPVLWLALGVFAFVQPADSVNPAQSRLSRWLERDVVAVLQDEVARHPRFGGQLIQVEVLGDNALADAVGVVLISGLQTSVSIAATGSGALPLPTDLRSIDDIECNNAGAEYRLLVQVTKRQQQGGLVSLRLVDASQRELRQFHWQGRLSAAEQEYLARPRERIASGRRDAPWQAENLDLAASQLGRDLICRLRPYVSSRMDLDWDPVALPDQRLATTMTGVRDLLSLPVELSLLENGPADVSLSVEVTALGNEVWRIGLAVQPVEKQSIPQMQVFSYLRLPGEVPANTLADPFPRVGAVPEGSALEYLDIQLLDARQQAARGSRADLLLKILVHNRSPWPIDYSMSISGGHYENCRPRQALYRHDRYGVLSGQAAPGQPRVAQVLLSGLHHKPAPLFGVPRCAGIGDIESLENFHAQGYRIVDYVRWSL